MATVDGLTKARMLAIEANSVVDGDINGSGNLILFRHDGTSIDAGHVVGTPGSNGSNGRGIVSAVINGSGNLIITYSDATSVDVGRVKGLDAAPGSVLVTPNTTIVRTADGRAKFANPTEDNDGATKEYVDESKSIQIVSGTNLNDLRTPGNYYVESAPSSGLNYPELRPGSVEVIVNGPLGSVLQRYTPWAIYGTEAYWQRAWSGSWYTWKRFVPEDVWESYTPQLLSTTTNPTMGNSTRVGRYMQRGSTVMMNVDIVFGSTFSAGSGAYRITLPVTPHNLCHAALQTLFITVGGDHQGHARIEGSAGNQRIQLHRDNSHYMVAMGSTMYAPVSGNRLTVWGTYESA